MQSRFHVASIPLLIALSLSGCRRTAAVADRPVPPPPPTVEPVEPLSALGPHLREIEASVDLNDRPVGALAPEQSATVAIVFASWCGHCRNQMPVMAQLQARHPGLRLLGINYQAHEEYAGRGGSSAVREFVSQHAPWLRVVPADDDAWSSLGGPARVPTIYVFDRNGRLVRAFDPRTDRVPNLAALEAALPR